MRVSVRLFRALVLCLVLPRSGWTQAGPGAPVAGPPVLTVTTNLPAGWIPARQTIELTLSRPLEAGEGHVALVVGGVDVTDLLEIRGQTLRYVPSAMTLPSGRSELVVYLVSPAEAWQEIARVQMRVLTPRGYEEVEATPLVDVGIKSQFAEGHSPPGNAPPRPRFVDLTLQGTLSSRMVRNGATWTNAVTIVGSSYEQEALRFHQRGDAAPQVDLSNYLVQVSRGGLTGSVGHLTVGASRHLVNSFSSRGLSVAAPLGPQATVTLAVVNATSIVGWSNPIGLARDGHRMVVGTIGVELVRGRPGALRAETSFLSGSLLPDTGYNQGAITDAQESRGASVRVTGSDRAQRVRVDGGYTRSRFTNPFDPLLALGSTLVPVRPETRDARYIDASVVVLDRTITEGQRASVTVFARHEMVDPFFKSIGAPGVRPDLRQNQIEAQATIGPASVQVQHTRLEENLDDLESMLTTRTRHC